MTLATLTNGPTGLPPAVVTLHPHRAARHDRHDARGVSVVGFALVMALRLVV